MREIFNRVFSWLGDNVMDEVIDTTVRAGITTLAGSGSFKDNLKDQAILTAADAAWGAFRPKKQPTNPAPTPAQVAQANAGTAGSATSTEALRKPNGSLGKYGTPGINGNGVFSMESVAPITSGIGALVNQNQEVEAYKKATEVVQPKAVDERGFFESMGDVVSGDEDYSRWDSIKQAFMPDKEGDPDALRKYGPMAAAILGGAYLGGVFDKEKVDEAPNRPYSVGKQNVFSRPGMYRPGVPQVSGRAQGGHVNGPGTGTSDDIPAYLSDGEFVMTNEAVRGAGGGDRQQGMRTMYNIMHDFERRA